MRIKINPAQIEIVERPEGYREFKCIPTHWIYHPPYNQFELYTEYTSSQQQRPVEKKELDFWSASDAALRIKNLTPEELDIREMIILASARLINPNTPKPWCSMKWAEQMESKFYGETYINKAKQTYERSETNLWTHSGMKSLPFPRNQFTAGWGMQKSLQKKTEHEPWHGGEGVWYSWEALEGLDVFKRRQEIEISSVVPEDGLLMLFVSHRWESPEHPDPTGRQLKSIKIGLTLSLAASILDKIEGSTLSGLPELFARYFAAQNVNKKILTELKPWAEKIKSIAQETTSDEEFIKKAKTLRVNQSLKYLKEIRNRIILWYDYSSMYQSPRTEEEERTFRYEIKRMNNIQANASTMVLAENEDYTRRAWCFLEICGGIRGDMVELIPSWGKSISIYNVIQKWSLISDQLIGAL